MAEVKWSDAAILDVFEIGEFISQGSPIMAGVFTNGILDAGDSLKNNPKRGRIIPEIGDEAAREIFYGSYRIMYNIADKGIEIVAVIHGARDFNPHNT